MGENWVNFKFEVQPSIEDKVANNWNSYYSQRNENGIRLIQGQGRKDKKMETPGLFLYGEDKGERETDTRGGFGSLDCWFVISITFLDWICSVLGVRFLGFGSLLLDWFWEFFAILLAEEEEHAYGGGSGCSLGRAYVVVLYCCILWAGSVEFERKRPKTWSFNELKVRSKIG
ncbi:hypothetical protein KY285_020016 [Solanum tuberosum]|nr:hypothetical protein KY285_020016 [Solanum tuberosum]